VVRVASLPGLALLKLVAWADRGGRMNKDAADLYRLAASYAEAGNTDRIYDQEMNLLETAGFDIQLAGAELLGRDVALMCSFSARTALEPLLRTRSTFERLVDQAIQTSAMPETAEIAEGLMRAFRRGLLGSAD
jgi:predicted nucleotidyltransferase